MPNAKLSAILLVALASGYPVYISYAYLTRPPTASEIQASINSTNKKIISRCDNTATRDATGTTTRAVELDSSRLRNICLQDLVGDLPITAEISDQKQVETTITHEMKVSTTGSVMPEPPRSVSVKTVTPPPNAKAITGAHGSTGASDDVPTIQAVLGLPDCREVQNEHSHIDRDRGSVYATDIACTHGASFTVVSPLWKKEYIVSSVGTDKRIGNYIVLKHANYLLVFGHTNSSHKVGDRIPAGVQIGYTDLSGITENYHVHFELWRDGYNITHDEMIGQGSQWNDTYSFALLRQRGWYTGIDDAIEFITGFEGYSATAYEDPKGSGRWSIGYGTTSHAGEVITQSEALSRIRDHVTEIVEFVYRNRLALTAGQRIAATSFFYNLGTGRPEMIQALRTRDPQTESLWKRYISAGSVNERGLTKRRQAEWLKFISK